MEYLTDTRDQAICRMTPTLMVPVYGELPQLERGHNRFLMARDGMYVEALTEALWMRFRIAPVEHPLPYGEITTQIMLMGGSVPKELRDIVIEDAMRAAPDEYAAALLYHPDSGYELHRPPVQSVSGGHITYDHTGYDEQQLAIDIHSHGHGDAYFSSTDDAADRLGVNLSIVLGRCESMFTMTAQARACMRGHFYNLEKCPLWMN